MVGNKPFLTIVVSYRHSHNKKNMLNGCYASNYNCKNSRNSKAAAEKRRQRHESKSECKSDKISKYKTDDVQIRQRNKSDVKNKNAVKGGERKERQDKPDPTDCIVMQWTCFSCAFFSSWLLSYLFPWESKLRSHCLSQLYSVHIQHSMCVRFNTLVCAVNSGMLSIFGIGKVFADFYFRTVFILA